MFRGAEPLCGTAAQGRKRAGRGYMLPLARVEHADLVATNVAAQAGARPHATHNAVNTVLQQSLSS